MVRDIVVFASLILLPAAAFAQGVPVITQTPPPPSSAGTPDTAATAPQVVDTPETVHGKLARGHRLYLGSDFAGALSAYEQAKEMEPGNAAIYYFIGCAQIKLDRFDDARVTLKTVSTLAGAKDESLSAKAMFLVAVLEENRRRFDTAKEDWGAYKGYAQTHQQAVTFIATAEARLEAIERKRKLDEEYAVVRERIASSQ